MKADGLEPNQASYMTAIGALRFDKGVESNATISKLREHFCDGDASSSYYLNMKWVAGKALGLWDAMNALGGKHAPTRAYNIMMGTMSACGELTKVLQLWDEMAVASVDR